MSIRTTNAPIAISICQNVILPRLAVIYLPAEMACLMQQEAEED